MLVRLSKDWQKKEDTFLDAIPGFLVQLSNELHRILLPKGKCLLIVPHWASCRAYGDMTHK